MKKRIYVFSFLLLFAIMALRAQSSLWVNCTDGTQKEMSLSDLNKLFFYEKSLVFTQNDGQETAFLMNEIRTLTFVHMSYDNSDASDDPSDSGTDSDNDDGSIDSDNGADGVSAVDGDKPYYLDTNPVEEWLVLHGGHDGEAEMSILSVDGGIVGHLSVTSGYPVYVGQLSKGLYIVKIGSQTFKMLKK